MLTSSPMLLLIAMGCVYRMFTRDWQAEPDYHGLAMFAGLLAALSLVVVLSVGAAVMGATK